MSVRKLLWLPSILYLLSACDEYMYVTLEEHAVVQGFSNGPFGTVTLAGNIAGLWQLPRGIAHAVLGGNKTVYIADFNADRITLLSVNSLTGQLMPLPNAVSTGKNPLHIVT